MLYVLSEDGQGLTEYGLIIMLIAIVVIVAMTVAGPVIANFYQSVADAFPDF